MYDKVDYHNQVMELCAAYKHVRTVRYPVKKVIFLRDAMLTNAYICYKYAHPEKKWRNISKSDFVSAFVLEACKTMMEERQFFQRSSTARFLTHAAAFAGRIARTVTTHGHEIIDSKRHFWTIERRGATPKVLAPSPVRSKATEVELHQKASTARDDGSKRGKSTQCIVCLLQLGPRAEAARKQHGAY